MADCRAIALTLGPERLVFESDCTPTGPLVSCCDGGAGAFGLFLQPRWGIAIILSRVRVRCRDRRAVRKFKWLVNHWSNAISLVSLFATPVWSVSASYVGGLPKHRDRVRVHGWVPDGAAVLGRFSLQQNRETTAPIAYRRDTTDYRLYPTRAGYKLGRNRDTPRGVQMEVRAGLNPDMVVRGQP